MANEQQRVGRALETVTVGLLPFFEREFREVYGDAWEQTVRGAYRNQASSISLPAGKWDAHAVLTAMWDHWNNVFRYKLTMMERSLVSELREFRNRWAHQELFSEDDSYRVLDSAYRLMIAVGNTTTAAEIAREKVEVLKQIVGREVNANVHAARYSRARLEDIVIYVICCVVMIAGVYYKFGHHFVPFVLFSVFSVFAFGFLIMRRTAESVPVHGVHECSKCNKVIYTEVCPYCDPVGRSSSILKSSSSTRYPPYNTEVPVRTHS